MRPWVIWMIRHRMGWLLKTLAVLLYPAHVLAYWDEAWKDVQNTLVNIDHEEYKK